MKPWILLLTALLATPAGAEELPVGIDLRVPSSSLQPGKTSQLIVELRGESGRPVAPAQALQVELAGARGLGAPERVTVPAGASRVEVPIRAPKAGLWQVAASSRGLLSGFGIVVCIAPKAAGIRTEEHRRAPRGAELRLPTMAAPAPAPPPPPAEEIEPAPAEASQGQVELVAHPTKVRRSREGWESLVDAFWFEGGVPALRSSPLSVTLVPEEGSPVIKNQNLQILSGQFKAEAPASISATSVDTAILRALYPGGKSTPVQIEFLSPTPAQLALAGASRSFRGLTGVTSDLLVRLLDDGGQPVVADKEIPVEVAVEGPLGTRSFQAKVPAGAIQAKVTLDLNRPGRYTAQATAPGIKASDPVEVRFALDWWLIFCSLLGGVLGSLTRVLYRREWPKGLARAVPLGIAAALLVLLLSIFGVLSVLGEALPAAKALETVPATSLFGALLLGFLAGLLFDKVFGRFLGERGDRKTKPSAPAPKEAPA